jgi:hypothetical protein
MNVSNLLTAVNAKELTYTRAVLAQFTTYMVDM